MSSEFKIEVAGEDALLIYFSDKMSVEASSKVQQAQLLIKQKLSNELNLKIEQWRLKVIYFQEAI